MKQEEKKRKVEQIEAKNSPRPGKQQKTEDTATIQSKGEGIIVTDTDESMSSASPESFEDDSEKSIGYSDSPPGTPEHYIIDNFGSAGDESARPKHFTTNMFRDDIEKFNQVRVQGAKAESEFVQSYIDEHGKDNVESADDVYSLLLGCAIDFKDIKLVEHILNIEHEGNILTYVDRTHFSPVSCVLGCKDYEILKLVGQYITNNSDHITKTDFSAAEDNNSISSRTSNPLFEYIESLDFYEHLLIPLYTKESLADLADLIGANYVPETFDEPDTWW